jgi:hypothetical protein
MGDFETKKVLRKTITAGRALAQLNGTLLNLPNPTLFLTCSGISNKYASPSTVLYSITPTVALGQVITERPNEKSYAKLVDGTYNQITIKILGTDLNPITILDPAMTIMLSIRDDNDP